MPEAPSTLPQHDALAVDATRSVAGESHRSRGLLPAVGTVLLGRYHLERHLGSGAGGEVFAARLVGDHGFSRAVAVKVLHPRQPERGFVAKAFVEEARVASRLHHPNIVAVHELGMWGARPFLAMELVDGLDLLALRDAAAEVGLRLPIELALHITLELARALAYAHDATGEGGQRLDLVHRDVSPRNVLVGWNGAVKLTDFGVARWRERCLEPTPHGGFRGTLVYTAPERLLGAPGDARADVFSLGCVLHFLVAGRSPLSPKERVLAFLRGTAPLALDPCLPADVRSLVACATARDPRERFPSALTMAQALGQALVARSQEERSLAMGAWLGRLRASRDTTARTMARRAAGLGPESPDADDGESSSSRDVTCSVSLADLQPSVVDAARSSAARAARAARDGRKPSPSSSLLVPFLVVLSMVLVFVGFILLAEAS